MCAEPVSADTVDSWQLPDRAPGAALESGRSPLLSKPDPVHTAVVIHEVDSALRTLIEREADGTRDVEIVFDAPTREWAGRRNSPTIDVYLYDIREDLRRRERGMHNVYEDNVIVSRHLPPRHFKLSYLVTAWTQRPEDEHRLLSSLLSCFLRYDALPGDVLSGPLTGLGLPIPITIALPPPEDRAFADVWSALGGELKPSIDLVVITPLDTGQQFHTGKPVDRPPRVSLGGSNGWPTRETKSRDGVEVWPVGTDGPTPTGSGGLTVRPGEPAGGSGGGADDESGTEGRGAKPTTGTAAGTATRSTTRRGRGSRATAGSAPSGDDPDASASSGDDPARSSSSASWQAATGWADAMAPLGSDTSTGPVPGRAAGRSGSGGSSVATPRSPGADEVTGATGSADTGSAKGRPGPRVAMTRVRAAKKRP